MTQLKEASQSAYDWLSEKDPKHWSRAFFTSFPICDMLLNNMCEAFNSTIFEARDKMIITMCETIRRYLAKRIEAKRVEGSKWKNGVGPRIWKILQKTQAIAIQHYVSFHGDSSFEIKTSGGDQYVVDLSNNYCACRKWQLCGLPCSHAMAGIMNRGLNPIE